MQIQDQVVIVEWDEITSIRLLPLTNQKGTKRKLCSRWCKTYQVRKKVGNSREGKGKNLIVG
ncbi:Uncharacterised protein [uncultured archaeon]|nr:Uncharacterised protein [uncultured archaeon]